MTFLSHYRSPLGRMTMASDGKYLIGLWFEGQKYFQSTLDADVDENDQLEVFSLTKQWLDVYFLGQEPTFLPPIRLIGSEFRQLVGQIMLSIPYGQTITYGEIAAAVSQHLGKPRMSSQAVGGAVGHNPISVIVPCHRVVGSDGNLTGYAGGIELKVKLLELEHADMNHLFIPQKSC